MRIISWNVNGFRAIYKKGFLAWLQKESPDILCLQETKAEEHQLEEELASIQGYHYFLCSGHKKGYSGTAVFSKEKPLSVARGMGHEPFDNEGRILHVEFPAFNLFNIYFPNGQSGLERLNYKMAFYEHFLQHAQGLRAQGKQLVICGDVNTAHKEIDIARPKENSTTSGFLPVERDWVDRFLAAGYVDTFRMFHPGLADQYTYWDMKSNARVRNVGWRIDYFFVNEQLRPRVRKAEILSEVMGSDHCPITLELSNS
jgi:exodeoxyribonuclease III